MSIIKAILLLCLCFFPERMYYAMQITKKSKKRTNKNINIFEIVKQNEMA